MRKLALTCTIGIFVFANAIAQTPIDKTVETFSFTLAGLGIGTSQVDFLMAKKGLSAPPPDAIDFREEIVEKIGKDNLEEITYYFDKDGDKPLYEIIIEFSDEPTRQAAAEKLLGAPNHPEIADHWIAGISNNVVNIAWSFQNKLVIAANLPGTEWTGDPMFNLPEGFELYKHLPSMSEWPETEMTRFIATLETQLEAGAADFANIKNSEETDGYFTCTAPLAGAEVSNIFKNDEDKWVISNTLVSGANGENATLWKLDAENVLGKLETQKIKLTRTKSKPAYGSTVDLFDVSDKAGKPTGMQVGVLQYEWGAEGIWNVDILVIIK